MNGVVIKTVPPITTDGWTPSKFRWSWHPRLSRAIAHGHTLCISDHGIGKTYSGRIVAQELGLPYWYVSASFGLERASLEGQYYPVQTEHGISLQGLDGFVSSSVRGDGLLVIDEFFRLPGDVQSVLFAAMDAHRADFTIAYRGETIRVGEKFRVLGFTNPPSPMYPEVEIADRALLSRFNFVLKLPFPNGNELARFMAHLGFPQEHVVQSIHFITKVRDAYDKGEIDNFISPRDLTFFAGALKLGLTPEEALEDTVVGKFGAQHHEAIVGFWKIHQKAIM